MMSNTYLEDTASAAAASIGPAPRPHCPKRHSNRDDETTANSILRKVLDLGASVAADKDIIKVQIGNFCRFFCVFLIGMFLNHQHIEIYRANRLSKSKVLISLDMPRFSRNRPD